LFLECSYFVHCCNKGQWPNWMKLNFFRPSGQMSNRGAPSGLRHTHILQCTAGKMFHQWAEVGNPNWHAVYFQNIVGPSVFKTVKVGTTVKYPAEAKVCMVQISTIKLVILSVIPSTPTSFLLSLVYYCQVGHDQLI